MEYESENVSIDALKECLRSVPHAEPIPSDLLQQLLSCLADVWLAFDGAGSNRTYSNKVKRAENVRWEPPLLKFTLERHGATVNGSTRAEVHYWEVNVQTRAAEIVRIGQRQLYPKAPPLKVKELASDHRWPFLLAWGL